MIDLVSYIQVTAILKRLTVLKSKGQIAIIIVGLISIALGFQTMLRLPTVILPSWFLVLLYLPFVIGISFALGLLAKALTKIEASKLTYTSIFVTLISLIFYLSGYKSNHKIIIPDNFSGQVKLFLSNESTDDFKLNNFGIGYLSKETYYNGFKPSVIKNGQDITKDITKYSEGSFGDAGLDGKIITSCKYLSFEVPGVSKDTMDMDLKKLIETGALDTMRIWNEGD